MPRPSWFPDPLGDQVHHTHYHVNFGQFFTFCDQYWGTLKRPQDMRSYQEPSVDATKKAS